MSGLTRLYRYPFGQVMTTKNLHAGGIIAIGFSVLIFHQFVLYGTSELGEEE